MGRSRSCLFLNPGIPSLLRIGREAPTVLTIALGKRYAGGPEFLLLRPAFSEANVPQRLINHWHTTTPRSTVQKLARLRHIAMGLARRDATLAPRTCVETCVETLAKKHLWAPATDEGGI